MDSEPDISTTSVVIDVATLTESFAEMSLFHIVCCLFKTGEHKAVIREKFSEVHPESTLLLACLENSCSLILDDWDGCKLELTESGNDVTVSIQSAHSLDAVTVKRNTVGGAMIELAGIMLEHLQIKNLEFEKKDSSSGITLHQLADIRNIRQLDCLTLGIDVLKEDEVHFFTQGFPHPKDYLQVDFISQPQFDGPSGGSINTNRFVTSSNCNFVDVNLLLNSQIANIQLSTELDEPQLNLLLHCWMAGDLNNFALLECRLKSPSDLQNVMAGIKLSEYEEAKRQSGRFQEDDILDFSFEGFGEFDGKDALHMIRNDGKITTVFLDKETDTTCDCLYVIVWNEDRPCKLTSD